MIHSEADLFRDIEWGDDALRLDRTLDRRLDFDLEPTHHASIIRGVAQEEGLSTISEYAVEWQAILRIAIGSGAIQQPLPGFDTKTSPQEEFTAIQTAKKSLRFLQLVEYVLTNTDT